MSNILNYKLVLLGDAAVGKSSTVERFVKDEFFDFQQPTIGASFFARQIKLDDGSTIKYEIWDTAGQDRYRTLAPMYYRGAAGAIVVYDICDADTYSGARTYIEELQRQGSPDVVIALVGNKLDLESKREVWENDVREYATQNNLIFFECSAKTGQNVAEIFLAIGNKLPRNQPAPRNNDAFIQLSTDNNNKKSGCC